MRRLFLAGLLGLLASRCDGLNARQESLIEGWLDCTECTAGELGSVAAIGPEAIPLLRARLLEGPPASRVARLVAERARVFARLTARGSPGTSIVGLPDSATFVSIYLGNDRARYQVRSARALAVIGGPDARAALDSALQLPLRPDVRERVRFARDSLRSK